MSGHGGGILCPFRAALTMGDGSSTCVSFCVRGGCRAAIEVAVLGVDGGPITVESAEAMLTPRMLQYAREAAATPDAQRARLDNEIHRAKVRVARLEVERRRLDQPVGRGGHVVRVPLTDGPTGRTQ